MMVSSEPSNPIWKKFDEVELTHSSEHHLIAIYRLLDEYGYARGTDIAKFLNLTRGSVSITLGKLEEKEYISTDVNKFYKLTSKGQDVVENILRKRDILRKFFGDVLGLRGDEAKIEADKIEHLISETASDRLEELVESFLTDSSEARQFRNMLSFPKQQPEAGK